MIGCRFFQNPFPAEGENVVVQISNIDTNLMIRLQLVEYNNLEAVIPFASTGLRLDKHETPQQKISTLGRYFVVKVIRIDSNSGFLDLDRKSITDDEQLSTIKRYHEHLAVHSYCIAIYNKLKNIIDDLELITIYKRFIWRFQDSDPYRMLQSFAEDREKLDQYISDVDFEQMDRQLLRDIIMQRFKQNPCTISVMVKITSSYSVLGVTVIKDSVAQALKIQDGWVFQKDERPIRVLINSPPQYKCEMIMKNKQDGIERMKKFLDELKQVLAKNGAQMSHDSISTQENKK